MSQPSNINAHLMADEASFGDSTVTTFDERPQIVGPVVPSGLTQEIIPLALAKQYANQGHWGALGPYGGSFEITSYLAGHGSTCAGAITANAQETMLSRAIGGLNVAQVGTTLSGSTSASEWALTAGTQVDGAVGFLGVLGDGDGEGQAFATDNPATFTSLIEVDAIPAAAAVQRAASNIYPIETSANDTIVSTRHEFMSGRQKYNAWGCFPTGVSITGINAGELPQATTTYGTSYWAAESASTFPTATSMDTDIPAPVAAGSFHMSAVGTATRTLHTVRDVSIDIGVNVIPLFGPGMANARQIITGARRVGVSAQISFTIDAEAAGTDTLGAIFTGSTWQQIMYTCSTEDGSALAFWFPRCRADGPRPVQFDDGGITRMRITMMAHSTLDTSSALTHASFIIAQS